MIRYDFSNNDYFMCINIKNTHERDYVIMYSIDIYNNLNTKIYTININEYQLIKLLFDIPKFINSIHDTTNVLGYTILNKVSARTTITLSTTCQEILDNNKKVFDFIISEYSFIYNKTIYIMNTVLSYEDLKDICFRIEPLIESLDLYMYDTDGGSIDILFDFLNND